MINRFFAALVIICAGVPANAGETKIAVAANFTATAKGLASSFQAQSGHKAILIFGSTGKLYTQILHGAPFDVFLAADQKRPQKAQAEGLAIAGSRFTYATGKIVLYSTNPDLVDEGGNILNGTKFFKLAIANPKTAPYGAAAIEAMTKLGVYNKVKNKIVKGDSIAQTYQFIMTGNAQLGFVALSQVIFDKNGSKWLVPADLYAPIRQDAALLKRGGENAAAKAFLAFLKSNEAHAIIKRFGYGLE